MAAHIPKLLSIAGSDPSGGAGVQGDLKTFSALRCYGMAAITALTAQNTKGVSLVHPVPPAVVAAQIDAIFADIEVDAIKIGMLAEPAIARAAADSLARAGARRIVFDPVLVATSGDSLSSTGLIETAIARLFPLAALVTPNLPEAAALLGAPAASAPGEMVEQGRALLARGARAVLMKGGHLPGEPLDILVEGESVQEFHGARAPTRNLHGTGCALSAAIAAHLAQGAELVPAIRAAKDFLARALGAADTLALGGGRGPPHVLHDLWKR